jgi:hypothetical protein
MYILEMFKMLVKPAVISHNDAWVTDRGVQVADVLLDMQRALTNVLNFRAMIYLWKEMDK